MFMYSVSGNKETIYVFVTYSRLIRGKKNYKGVIIWKYNGTWTITVFDDFSPAPSYDNVRESWKDLLSLHTLATNDPDAYEFSKKEVALAILIDQIMDQDPLFYPIDSIDEIYPSPALASEILNAINMLEDGAFGVERIDPAQILDGVVAEMSREFPSLSSRIESISYAIESPPAIAYVNTGDTYNQTVVSIEETIYTTQDGEHGLLRESWGDALEFIQEKVRACLEYMLLDMASSKHFEVAFEQVADEWRVRMTLADETTSSKVIPRHSALAIVNDILSKL